MYNTLHSFDHVLPHFPSILHGHPTVHKDMEKSWLSLISKGWKIEHIFFQLLTMVTGYLEHFRQMGFHNHRVL